MRFINPIKFILMALVLNIVQGFNASAANFENQLSPLARHSYLVDVAGKWTINEVQNMPFKLLNGPLARGYTPTVTWMKLEVAASNLPELIVGVQPTFLDDVQLYSPRATGGWVMQQQGDQFAYRERPRKEVIFSFPIKPSAQQISVHYLRIVTTSSHLIYAQVRSPDSSHSFDNTLHSFMGLYFGLVMMMLLWALLRWFQTHDLLWGANVFLQLASVCIAMGNMGFVAKFLLPDQPAVADLWVSYFAALHFFAGSVFILGLVLSFKPHWAVIVGFAWSVFILSPVVFVLIMQGQVRTAMSINTLGLLVAPLLNSVGTFFVRPTDLLLRYALRATYMVLTLYLLFFALPVFGLATVTDMHLYPALLANFFTSGMFLLVLMRRDHLLVQERQQVAIQAEKTNQLLVWEQERRVESAGFIDMLLHELKAPLSSIRLTAKSLGSKKVTDPAQLERRLQNIQISIDDMDRVLEQTREMERLEQGYLEFKFQTHDIVPVLQALIAEKNVEHRVVAQLPMQCLVVTDVNLFALMVKNLLDNALNYSPSGSLVQVWLRKTVYQKQEFVTLSVHNEAVNGVLPDVKKMFKKYYRGEASERIVGSGLGLYWVKGVSRKMGGSVVYTGQGARVIFELRLPQQTP